MGILDNFESAWDIGFQFESSGLAQTSSDICCDGCTCQTSDAHKPEN
jgi:hypothetical protein